MAYNMQQMMIFISALVEMLSVSNQIEPLI